MLGNEEPETSMPGEIVAHAEWYDFEAKYGEGGMELAVPAPISEIETARVRELAVEVFALAGCSGLARCDFFVEPDGTVLVNEINTMPGFTETSVYAKLLEAGGLSYPELCDRLVALAVERHRARPLVSSSELAAGSVEQLDVADFDLEATFLVARRRGLVEPDQEVLGGRRRGAGRLPRPCPRPSLRRPVRPILRSLPAAPPAAAKICASQPGVGERITIFVGVAAAFVVT